MPLTLELKKSDSPVLGFMRERFSKVAAVRPYWSECVKGRSTILPAIDRPPWTTLGTAIDIRLRYYFAVTPPEELVAAEGMLSIGGLARVSDKAGRRVFAETVEEAEAIAHARDEAFWASHTAPVGPAGLRVGVTFTTWRERPAGPNAERWDALRPAAALALALLDRLRAETARLAPIGRRLAPEDEAELCRLCYALALCEELARAGLTIRSPLYELAPGATLADFLALARPELVDDLCRLSWAFYDGYAPLLSEPVILNPTLTGPAPIGVADADLIVGRCLVEIKTRKEPRLDPYDLYQLLGYVLLDHDDEFGIDEVGIYLTRQALLVRWGLAELIPLLSDGAAPPLPDLRAEFRAFLVPGS